MSNNFQNPQLQQAMPQMQMQPMHPQHFQNMNSGLGAGNNMGNMNSPLIQNQLKTTQNQQNIPQQMPPNQHNFNQQTTQMNKPHPHSKYFYKGNIDYPSYPTFLPIEKFGELLLNASNACKQINFEPVYVDKPKEGSIFLICIPKNDENIIDIPSDGYGWLDDEKHLKTIAIDKDREVECYERKLGFAQGQLYCNISRRRFRMRSRNYPMLEMLQYTKLHETVPVIPAQIKVQPQNIRLVAGYPPQPQQQMQQQMQQQQQQQQYKQNMNHMNKPMMQQQQIPQQQSYSRPHTPHRRKLSSNPYRYDDDDNDKSGDEMDILQSRDISIGRYRRNHDYMSEILSPYNIDSIDPPEIIDISSIDNINSEMEKLNKEIEDLEKNIMEKNKKNTSYIHSSINKISKCKTEEELQKITLEVNNYLDIQLIPKTDVRKVKL